MEFDNYFKLELDAKNVNEGFARGVVAMFCTELKPTIAEINDIKKQQNASKCLHSVAFFMNLRIDFRKVLCRNHRAREVRCGFLAR